jgi:hypothetical protein
VLYLPPSSPPPAGSVMTLFDGTSLANWRMAGRGTFHVVDGALQSVPSFDLGLLWCTIPMPTNYVLELEFFTRTMQTNSGAVYAVSYPGNPSEISGFPAGTPGDFVNPQDALVLGWNQYRIEVNNNVIKVALNGNNTAQYTIPDPPTVNFPPPWDQRRGRYPASEPTFIGLQSYSNYSYTTAFRNMRATVLCC